jgi:biopolymer transport protein ExbD
MRRFSDRQSLVTLSDINITPLLDLAFVLLIIFIIASPMMKNSIKLDLPQGGSPEQSLKKSDIRIVEIDRQGQLRLSGKSTNLATMLDAVSSAFKKNPRLIVKVDADENSTYGTAFSVVDGLRELGIPISLGSIPNN